MNIKETYAFSLIARAAYTNLGKAEEFNSDLFNRALFAAARHIPFTFSNDKNAKEISDAYDFFGQYNDPLTDFSGSIFPEKSSSKPMPVFTRTEFFGDVVVGAGVFVADPELNGSIWGGQSVKTI